MLEALHTQKEALNS